MGSDAGKGMSIVAGIIILLGTFFFAMLQIGGLFYSGIGGALNIIDLITDTNTYAVILGIPSWAVYILLVVDILFIISGVLVLIGASSRATAIIGSILPLLIGLLLILDAFNVSIGIDVISYLIIFQGTELISGIIPFNYELAGASLGAFVLAVGGVLGLISGFLER